MLVEDDHGFQKMLVMHYQHTTNYKQMTIHKVQCEGSPTTKETSPTELLHIHVRWKQYHTIVM